MHLQPVASTLCLLRRGHRRPFFPSVNRALAVSRQDQGQFWRAPLQLSKEQHPRLRNLGTLPPTLGGISATGPDLWLVACPCLKPATHRADAPSLFRSRLALSGTPPGHSPRCLSPRPTRLIIVPWISSSHLWLSTTTKAVHCGPRPLTDNRSQSLRQTLAPNGDCPCSRDVGRKAVDLSLKTGTEERLSVMSPSRSLLTAHEDDHH